MDNFFKKIKAWCKKWGNKLAIGLGSILVLIQGAIDYIHKLFK